MITKRTFLAALIIFVACKNTDAQMPTDSLIAWWPFNGNHQDGSGNNHNGSATGTSFDTDRFGNPSSACYFNGTFDIVQVDHHPDMNSLPITFSWWMKPEVEDDGGTIFYKYAPATWNGYNISYWPSNPPTAQWEAAYRAEQFTGVYQTYDNPFTWALDFNAFDNNWNHYAFVVDSLSGTLYKNGNVLATYPWWFQGGTGSAFAVSGPWDLTLGGGVHGLLDDLAIWNRAFSATEIYNLYTGSSPYLAYFPDNDQDGYGNPLIPIESNTGAPIGYVVDNRDCNDNDPAVYPGATCTDNNDLTINDQYSIECVCEGLFIDPTCATLPPTLQNGIIGYWPFCGNTQDESGNGNHGITHYNVEPTTDRFGNANGAYYFDGVRSAIEIPHNDIFSTLPLTVAMWVKLDTFQLRNPSGTIVSKGLLSNNNNTVEGWGSFITYGDSSIKAMDYSSYWDCGTSEQNFGCIPFSDANNANLYDNQWHQITIAFTSSSSTIYLDGNYYFSDSPFYYSNYESIVIGATKDNYAWLYDEFKNAFKGKIDDVTLWNRALSEPEIFALMTTQHQPIGRAFLDYNNSCIPNISGIKNITGVITPGNLQVTSDNLGEFHLNNGALPDGSYTISLLDNPDYSYTCTNAQTFTITNGIIDSEFHFGMLPLNPSCPSMEGALADSLKAFWPFCASALDASGNNNNGEIFNAISTKDRFGNENQAFLFDGETSKIIFQGVDLPLGNSPRTISVWYKSVWDSGIWYEQGTGYLMGSTHESENYYPHYGGEYLMEDYTIEYDGIDFYFNGLGGVGSYPCTGGIGTTNNWHHIVGVYHGSDSLEAYFDGKNIFPAFTGPYSDCGWTEDSYSTYWDSLVINTPLQDIIIGGLANNPEWGWDYQFFEGYIDDVAIWNRALTAEEVNTLYGNFAPVVGCTDSTATNYNPFATSNAGCTYQIDAIVYHDINGNGIREDNEPGLPNVQISTPNQISWSNELGHVGFSVITANTTLNLGELPENWTTSTSTQYLIDISMGNDTAYFGVIINPGPALIEVVPTGPLQDVVQCIAGYNGGLSIHNIGSQPVSGFITLYCDSLYTPEILNNFVAQPILSEPGQAIWQLENFQPGDFELISYHVNGPGVEYFGTPHSFDISALLYDQEGNTIVNQSWVTHTTVSCAYDPNDLTPTPIGYTNNHFIRAGDRIKFRVRFQNLGNAPATDVRVEQYLDSTVWDLSSFESPYPISAEVGCLHDDGVMNLETGMLIYMFDNIMLPDSASDPLGSRREFHYYVSARQDLLAGTQLYNQASIYFDNNPPIITNQTFHTIFDCSSFTGPLGDTSICVGETAMVFATQPYVDSYTWSFDAFQSYGDTLVLSNLPAGNQSLSLFTTNELCGVDGESHTYNFWVHPLPETDIINNGGVLTVSDGTEWQWYYQDSSIEGATENTYTVQDTGSYFVWITNEYGCSIESETIVYVTGVEDVTSIENEFTISPNPMKNEAWLKGPAGIHDLMLYDQMGACVRKWTSDSTNTVIERKSLPAGLYHLRITDANHSWTIRIIME